MTCHCRATRGSRVISADGNYENSTFLTGDVVIKHYARAERYGAEFRALGAFASSKRCPALITACPEHLTIVMTRLPGTPAGVDFAAEPDPGWTVVDTAAALWDLHEVGREWMRCHQPEWSLEEDFTVRIAHRIASIGITGPMLRRCEAWWSEAAVLLRGHSPTLLHHDLKPSNVLVGRSSVHLVDFDQARPGHPLSDIGKAIWRLVPGSVTLQRLLLATYLGRRPDAKEERIVSIFRTCHAIGALAYWNDYQPPAYLRHAVAASAIVADTIGIRIGPGHSQVVAGRGARGH